MPVTAKLCVHKYLWRDYGRPLSGAWQLTFTDNEAIVILVLIAIALVFTQAEVWCLVRWAVRRYTRPIQLPDDDIPGSLSKLTQREAVASLLSNIRARTRRFGGHSDVVASRPTMVSVSPWAGIAALINLAAFMALEAVVPWALTGGLETPIVQSKQGRCDQGIDQAWNQPRPGFYAANKYEKCWFNTSGISSACGRENGILFDRPGVQVSRDAPCPFAEAACHPDARPLQLDLVNISVRAVGLNIESDLQLSRRTVCAPLRLDRFISHQPDGTTWLEFGRTNETMNLRNSLPRPYMRQRLSSSDGRIKPSSDFRWAKGGYPDLRYWEIWGDQIHPDLVATDEEVLVIIYSPGRMVYDEPIHDPMYSAHQKLTGVSLYFPDYEYTAMACVEQHRLCTGASGECTPYMGSASLHWPCSSAWTPGSGGHQLGCPRIRDLGTIISFLRERGILAMLALRGNEWDLEAWRVDPLRQWELDLESWFESSFLMRRYDMLEGFYPSEVESEGGLLFLDGDYTNINFLGLVVMLAGIVLVAGLNRADGIRKAIRGLGRFLRVRAADALIPIKRQLRGLGRAVDPKSALPRACGRTPSESNCQGEELQATDRAPEMRPSELPRLGSENNRVTVEETEQAGQRV